MHENIEPYQGVYINSSIEIDIQCCSNLHVHAAVANSLYSCTCFDLRVFISTTLSDCDVAVNNHLDPHRSGLLE